jgi:hypothetical protein
MHDRRTGSNPKGLQLTNKTLNFDALLNANSIPMLRRTRGILQRRKRRQRLLTNWHADSQANIGIMIHPGGSLLYSESSDDKLHLTNDSGRFVRYSCVEGNLRVFEAPDFGSGPENVSQIGPAFCSQTLEGFKVEYVQQNNCNVACLLTRFICSARKPSSHIQQKALICGAIKRPWDDLDLG